MPKWIHTRLIKKSVYTSLVFSLAAFSSPQKNDLIELNGFLYGRNESKFRSQDQNKIYVLKPGVRARVEKTEHLPSGNYGLCIQIQNASDTVNLPKNNQCVWVYYDFKNPALKLFSVGNNQTKKQELLDSWIKDGKKVSLKNQSDPTKAQAAQTTRQVQAVADKPKTSESDSKSETTHAIKQIDKLNEGMNKALNNSEQSCDNCTPNKLLTFETCSDRKGSGYLEPALEKILNQSAHSDLYKSSQKEIIKLSCIQRNMQNFSNSSTFYRNCAPSQIRGGQAVGKACLSENYVQVTAKSFNLVADCLGDHVAGSNTGKNQAALSIFAFMAQESGMHVNARSGTGAGGPGQMTGGAVTAVNKNLTNIKNHLKNHPNSMCSTVLEKVLEKPLKPTANACDRRSINEDNPLKNMAYTFAYQGITRKMLENTIFDEALFGRVVSSKLPAEEKDRLMMELSSWAHNTGPAGMSYPLSFLMRHYVQNKKTVSTAEDVDQLFKTLRSFMQTHAHPANRTPGRYLETANYYNNIQKKMKNITQEPRLCLAN